MTRIAINGMGRIGRAAFKQIFEDGSLELAAVNDLVPAAELAYLLKHDSVYGRYGRDVRVQSSRLVVNGQSCVALSEKNLDKLPWRDLAVDIVLECTGVFTHEADLKRHVRPSAITSAPTPTSAWTRRGGSFSTWTGQIRSVRSGPSERCRVVAVSPSATPFRYGATGRPARSSSSCGLGA